MKIRTARLQVACRGKGASWPPEQLPAVADGRRESGYTGGMSTKSEHVTSVRAARRLRRVRDGPLATASVGPRRARIPLGHPHPHPHHAAPRGAPAPRHASA
ncbi:hypothetical protein [Streptomyces sp. NPDC056013]|uniref:hypothetical protein n=1 Tax=Streptomyces sp. NPDC056013 TaxID=3345680 RepID=UPI0035DF457A